MKKTNLIALRVIVLMAIILITSCKKDETTIKTITETPMQTTISQQLVVDSVTMYVNNFWEFGQKLYFSKNGKVTKLGCKMANTGSYRVSIWDYTTKNLIAATTVMVTDSTKFVYNNISPIAVTANTRYVISLNNTFNGQAKRYYIYFKKANLTGSIYPFTTGSITYEANHETSSSTSVYPEVQVAGAQYFISGVADLQFEYDE